ncbi:hypothetical protein [Methylobacterium indicum]|uniref:Uncharacterized protein n=1 Tax=Methylobacterium indicum TaxID=1775910 RepID=A0A8H8WYY8_9HYPH|nr:hypothetical protein [Methylobacterium indicum]BCM87014.1 hypothetical protein mvi_54750 [Methylobacterium indicum]
MSGTAEPTWSRPPPAVPSSPSLTRLGRWGRWLLKGGGPVGRAASAIFDASPTAMPWVDEVPRDDFERALFAKARELEAQGVDRDEILKWFRGEGLLMLHLKRKTKITKRQNRRRIPKLFEFQGRQIRRNYARSHANVLKIEEDIQPIRRASPKNCEIATTILKVVGTQPGGTAADELDRGWTAAGGELQKGAG